MSTTLQLVNRLRRRFREEDITALGDDLSTFLVDLLNESKRDLLEAYNWDFDMRTDGELVTMPTVTSVVVANNGFNTFTATLTAAQVVGQYAVAKAIITSDAAYGDTAIRVVYLVPGVISLLGLAIDWPGTSNAAATIRLVFDEYVLPSIVRAVTSVRHQEQDLQVIEVDRDIGLDGYAPRPHGDIGDAPDRVFIGKRATSTYDTSAQDSTEVSGITLKLDPTPSSALLISYSYIYRHPDCSDTQGLDGVDPSIEDLIVRLAEARGTMSGLGSDVQTGAAMETEVLNRAAALHGNQRRDPLRRVIIQPTFGGRSIPSGFGRFPRSFGSL